MRKFYLKTLGVCLSLFAFNASAQTTYYVKTDGVLGAAATSWATASKDLQDVINTAVSGDKIYVAIGTYLPNRPANTSNVIDVANRDNAFVLKNGVSIYGGFVGTESNESERIAGNKSILSGDLAGNDVDETGANTNTYMTSNKVDNAYHVVLAIDINNNTVFDGFTVTKGDASATTQSTVNIGSGAIDRRFGGGMYVFNSGLNFNITNVVISINRANGDGGSGSVTGAGIYMYSSSPTMNNCEISKGFNMNNLPKTAGYNYGSGMSMISGSNPIIQNTTFSGNFGSYGAALAINASNPTFTNCTFKLNHSNNGRGGAIDLRGGLPVFTNCMFSENSVASSDGATFYNYSGRPTFVNCIFYKNTTSGNATVYATGNGSNFGAVFINNTFYDNKNTRTGSGNTYTAGMQIRAISTSTTTINNTTYPDRKTYLYNNLFFNNTFSNTALDINTPDFYVTNATLLGAVNNNIVQQTESVPVGQGNFSADPLFISTTPGQLGFLAPQTNSPAKDAGNDTYNNSILDYNGNARKTGVIDMGAVEYSTVLPVSFINFIAKATTVGVQLNWKVASESNNKQYVISRSTDGKNYNLIARVTGVGTTVISQSYGFVDQTAANGTYYYKLEQEDLNGDVNYLATEVVKIGLSNNSVNVYPNPTRNNIAVALTAGLYDKYSIIGLQGVTILNGNITNVDNQINLNLSDIAPGIYFLKLTGNAGSKSSRVIKL